MEINTEMIQMMKLTSKESTSSIRNIFKDLKTIVIMNVPMRNVRREMSDTFKRTKYKYNIKNSIEI